MKKQKRMIPLLLLALFAVLFGVYRPKDDFVVDVRFSDASEQKQTFESTYPRFIGDEGVLDASNVGVKSRIESEEETEIEPTEEPELDSSDEVLDADEQEVAEEKIEEESEKPTSSEKETKQAETVEVQTPPESEQLEATEVKRPQIAMPKTSLAVADYLLPLSNSEERIEPVTHVVVHFTSNALNKPGNPYLIDDTYNIFKNSGVSSHYVIGRAGEIYSLVAEDRVAYHAGQGQLPGFPEYNDRLNHHSIGIELLAVGTREEMIPMITAEKFDHIDPNFVGYTEAQYQALSTLLNDIIARNPTVQKNRQHIVGHDEYAPGRKTDPGTLFDWSKLGL